MNLTEFLETVVSSSRAPVNIKVFKFLTLQCRPGLIYIIELAMRALFWQQSSHSESENPNNYGPGLVSRVFTGPDISAD